MANRIAAYGDWPEDWFAPVDDFHEARRDLILAERSHLRENVMAVLQKEWITLSIGWNCDMHPSHVKFLRSALRAMRRFHIDRQQVI